MLLRREVEVVPAGRQQNRKLAMGEVEEAVVVLLQLPEPKMQT